MAKLRASRRKTDSLSVQLSAEQSFGNQIRKEDVQNGISDEVVHEDRHNQLPPVALDQPFESLFLENRPVFTAFFPRKVRFKSHTSLDSSIDSTRTKERNNQGFAVGLGMESRERKVASEFNKSNTRKFPSFVISCVNQGLCLCNSYQFSSLHVKNLAPRIT